MQEVQLMCGNFHRDVTPTVKGRLKVALGEVCELDKI
jgi:hypothetical protein